MQQHGKLCRWNDDRGFGFIKPDAGGNDVFVHISAFPRNAEKPVVGDSLSYEIEMRDGKPRAIDIQTARISHSKINRKLENTRDGKSNAGIIISALLFLALCIIVYSKFYKKPQIAADEMAISSQTTGDTRTDAEIRQAIRDSLNQSGNSRPQSIAVSKAPTSSGFACDGRTHCSQMTSCEEATFFLNNCPNVQMDGGDGQGRPDGVPCESQWCVNN
mgnify:FL=1